MKDVNSLGSNLAYLKQLASASMDGIGAPRREMRAGVSSGPLPSVVWAPAAVGGVVGVLATKSDEEPQSMVQDGIGWTGRYAPWVRCRLGLCVRSTAPTRCSHLCAAHQCHP